MNKLNSVIGLAYDKRNQLGNGIRILRNEFYNREELITKIIEVGAVPSIKGRSVYLDEFYRQPAKNSLRARMQASLNYVINHFDNDIDELDLQVTFFTEAKSTNPISDHLHIMLSEHEFEAIN